MGACICKQDKDVDLPANKSNAQPSESETLDALMEETGGKNTKEQEGPKKNLKKKLCWKRNKKGGQAGTGKSASGNTVLGNEQFETRVSLKPVTTECKAVQADIEGIQFCVTDTPNNLDDDIDSSMKDKHEMKSKQLFQSEPCNGKHEEEEEPKKNLKREYSGTKGSAALLGLVGAGESASRKTILGNELFESRVSSKTVSAERKESETERDHTHASVTDTPDNLDDEINSSMKDKHEMKRKQLCQSEPCSGKHEEEEEPKKNLKRKYSGTTVNLVLLGMAGTGKSASGNTILRKKLFESRISSNPITTECKEAETEIEGTRVRVIDTPDIFDDEMKSSVKDKHVTKCRQLCQSGPCVFLLVMHVSRFTDGERDILTKLQKAFGSKVHEHTVVLFTRGDDLKYDDISLEEFLSSCQPDLKKVVEKCDKRCVLFENKASDSHQVEELMETVNKMLEEQQK